MLHNDQGTNPEEDTIIVNIYAPNIQASLYIRQMLTAIKGKTGSNTIIVRDLNSSLTPMDRSFKQKINKEMQALHDTLDQINLIDIYRTFHLKAVEYNFLSSTQNILQDRSYLGLQIKTL